MQVQRYMHEWGYNIEVEHLFRSWEYLKMTPIK